VLLPQHALIFCHLAYLPALGSYIHLIV